MKGNKQKIVEKRERGNIIKYKKRKEKRSIKKCMT